MGLIGILLLVILALSAVLLVTVVLLQDEQGEGIGGLFGGGSATPFGSRSGNILTRFTAVLATVFLVCCFALAWISRTPEVGNVVGRARQESLSSTEKTDWWIPSQNAESAGADAAQPVEVGPAAGPAAGGK